jgi:uncharacterized protein (DUF1330 family)
MGAYLIFDIEVSDLNVCKSYVSSAPLFIEVFVEAYSEQYVVLGRDAQVIEVG